MKKTEKAELISSVAQKVSNSLGMYLTDFSGITVEEITKLRNEFRKVGVEYVVVKNTLFKKALESVGGFDAMYPSLKFSTGVAISYDDPVTPARVIKKFQEQVEGKLNCKACVIGKEVYDGKKLDEFSKIPTRGEIVSSILGSLQAPASNIVGVLNAVARDIVSVLDAIEKKKAA